MLLEYIFFSLRTPFFRGQFLNAVPTWPEGVLPVNYGFEKYAPRQGEGNALHLLHPPCHYHLTTLLEALLGRAVCFFYPLSALWSFFSLNPSFPFLFRSRGKGQCFRVETTSTKENNGQQKKRPGNADNQTPVFMRQDSRRCTRVVGK